MALVIIRQRRISLRLIKIYLEQLYRKDPLTHRHSINVQGYASILSSLLGSEYNPVNLRLLGFLHDIGKLEIPVEILIKPGKLTFSESIMMKQHPILGYRMLKDGPFSGKAHAVLSHHERWDGSGYPEGLCGMHIPIEARIMAIADAYDAMTGFRSYRDSMSPIMAVEEIRRNAGTQFDPTLAEIFTSEMTKHMDQEKWVFKEMI